MRGWTHSGFGVHHAVRLDADDRAGRERLAHYMLRCPFSLDRMIRVTEQGTVIYLAEKKAGRRFPVAGEPRSVRRRQPQLPSLRRPGLTSTSSRNPRPAEPVWSAG